MRKAINENPRVQMALLAVLALAVGVILYIQLGGGGGGGEEVPPPDPSAEAIDTAPADDQVVDEGGATGVPDGQVVEIQPEELVAGPGLPKKVVRAYEDGSTIMLAVVAPDAIADKQLLANAKKAASEDKDIALFQVSPKKVSDYSRVTIGVDVNRNPVLVVVTPLDVTGEGAPPRGWASYGYRNVESVLQTVADAQFDGPVGTLSP